MAGQKPWVQLFRGEEEVGRTKVTVDADADIDNLRDAVKAKFADDLEGVSAARLKVFLAAAPDGAGGAGAGAAAGLRTVDGLDQLRGNRSAAAVRR